MTTSPTPVLLPVDTENQIHVTVHALIAGEIWLPYNMVYQDSVHEPREIGCQVPDFVFMITHPTHGRALFDLGIRKHAKGFPPAVGPTLQKFRVQCEEDVADVLRRGNINPGDISKIIFSHLHWDHTGDPTPFTNAEAILGSGSKAALQDTYPSNPNSPVMALPENMKTNFIDFAESTAQDKTTPFGPYEHAIDYYGDGSLYLVDSPGHTPGHMAAAARIAADSFVFLAADACHNRLCYNPGTRLISQRSHGDIEAARKTVQWLSELNKEHKNVVVILAHEHERVEEMPFFPGPDLKEWALGEIEKK